MSAQRQSTNYRKGEQVGADHNKAPLSSSSSKQEHNDYNSNSDNKEDQQESIHDNDSQNENAELENRKKEKKAWNMNDYVNESTSVLSEIKNLSGIDVVVNLNMESKSKQDK